jgi:hypothetical protein
MALTWASPAFKNTRQLFLFLAVLILPSILIAYQAWKIAAQKEELADSPS